MQYVDLHSHTCASDGSDTPSELVKKAAKIGLQAIAITDHDTLSGLDEATKQGLESNIEVIRGCELSVHSDGGELHILGLYIDKDAIELEHTLEKLRQYRTDRNKIIVDRLKEMGLDIDYDDVLNLAGGDAVGRPHIAAVLLQKGYITSISQAFTSYLGSKGKAYEPKKVLVIEEAMHLLTSAKATICLAHPGLLSCTESWLNGLLKDLKFMGLSAIEAYHSAHSRRDEDMCLRLARNHGLDVSGGSDYHGKTKPQIQLGFGKGNLRIGVELLEKIKQRRLMNGLPL